MICFPFLAGYLIIYYFYYYSFFEEQFACSSKHVFHKEMFVMCLTIFLTVPCNYNSNIYRTWQQQKLIT